jgi:hypothetical protein
MRTVREKERGNILDLVDEYDSSTSQKIGFVRLL